MRLVGQKYFARILCRSLSSCTANRSLKRSPDLHSIQVQFNRP